MSTKSIASAPCQHKFCKTSLPRPGVLLVTICRPDVLNCLTTEASSELDTVFQQFDKEPSLRVAIITGQGRAFCVGADLKEWQSLHAKGKRMVFPANGFAGITLRQGKKPIIAAVNGPAYGGGCEIVVNCDLVVAAATATFCLPEVKRGVAPVGGVLPRLIRTVGRQRAYEMALTGGMVSAAQFKDWGVCNAVVDGDVVERAVQYAVQIAENSPDAVIVAREGLKLGWEGLGVVDASTKFLDGWASRLYDGSNLDEGLRAFREKRQPRWSDSKL